ncbi:Flagella-associated GTP-binding protein [Bordetella parapertussis]|nr:flagellar biosynthesis protein FlhF [Bordetella parapertussis]MEB2660780.1 flagellar biosynthesis protein FlhF [Bordetella parapertussis]WNY37311.1 flagellar biosynthesis protein FlhF [Bordetella parapertussis]SQH18121.1 Flagella-associated GTP-binding protein [Bordetella parapertussis]SUV58766.1 Flagella-associated GTP-binding protein [Bordetella parapertussis]SUV79304.1 flagellar biosynthesis protein [Bordetella parapertussis]
MKLSRFVAASSREVMRLVREALGPDALIVSNRSVAEGIEVVATLDETPAAASATPLPDAPAAPPADMPAADAPAPLSMARLPDAPMPAAMPAGRVSPGLEAGVQAAIDALRGSLESRMDGLLWSTREGPGREPVGAGLFRALLEAGFSMPLARILLERLPQALDATQALAWARNELVTHLPVLRREDDLLAGGGVFALVGPTGVGKTTTLAKLAARCVAREGREQVAMLTTDNFRIGALEQLQIYGRLMGIPAHSVRDADELRDALGSLGNRRIILIDTTGISQRDRQVAGQAAMLCNAGKPVRRLLVLNAASQGDTLDEVAHAYRNGVGEDVVGCIITKLDEASRLAPALDTAIRHRLPIHYVSYGQKVPEHMALARADELIDRTLATLQRVKPLYAPSEADLAALCSASREQARDEPAQRRQMLAATLLGQGGAAARDLDGALDWLRDDPACAQARGHGRPGHGPGAGRRGAGPGAPGLSRRQQPLSAGHARQGGAARRRPAAGHLAVGFADERPRRGAGRARPAIDAAAWPAGGVRAGRTGRRQSDSGPAGAHRLPVGRAGSIAARACVRRRLGPAMAGAGRAGRRVAGALRRRHAGAAGPVSHFAQGRGPRAGIPAGG